MYIWGSITLQPPGNTCGIDSSEGGGDDALITCGNKVHICHVYGAAKRFDPEESTCGIDSGERGGDDAFITCFSKEHICHMYIGHCIYVMCI